MEKSKEGAQYDISEGTFRKGEIGVNDLMSMETVDSDFSEVGDEKMHRDINEAECSKHKKAKKKKKRSKSGRQDMQKIWSVEELRWSFYQLESNIVEEASQTWELGKVLGLKENEDEAEIQKKIMAMERRDKKKEKKRAQEGKEKTTDLIQ